MAKAHASKKYLTIDNVIVFYDKKSGQFELTTKDSDLLGKPFRVSIKPGSETDSSLRELFKENSMLPESSLNAILKKLPDSVMFPSDLLKENSSFYDTSIPLGSRSSGSPLFWSVADVPNLFITGISGSGKSMIVNSVLEWVSAKKEVWQWSGVDFKQLEFSPFLETVSDLGVAVDLETTVGLLRKVSEMKDERYKVMADARVKDFSLVSEHKYKRHLIAIDEFGVLDQNDATDNPEVSELKREANAILGDLVRTGRAAGIHIILSTQKRTSFLTKNQAMLNSGAHIDLLRSHSELSSRKGEEQFSDAVQGRSCYVFGKSKVIFQAYYHPKEG